MSYSIKLSKTFHRHKNWMRRRIIDNPLSSLLPLKAPASLTISTSILPLHASIPPSTPRLHPTSFYSTPPAHLLPLHASYPPPSTPRLLPPLSTPRLLPTSFQSTPPFHLLPLHTSCPPPSTPPLLCTSPSTVLTFFFNIKEMIVYRNVVGLRYA